MTTNLERITGTNMILANGKLRLIVLTAIALILPLVALTCGGGDDEEDGGPVNGDGAETSFDIAMHETGGNFFDLEGEKNPTLRVPAGEEITVNLTNDGAAIHNMRFAGDDNKYDNGDDAVSEPALVSATQTATLTFTAPEEKGSYDYRCDYHPTDMLGEIEVQ
jgi:plastocyanin